MSFSFLNYSAWSTYRIRIPMDHCRPTSPGLSFAFWSVNHRWIFRHSFILARIFHRKPCACWSVCQLRWSSPSLPRFSSNDASYRLNTISFIVWSIFPTRFCLWKKVPPRMNYTINIAAFNRLHHRRWVTLFSLNRRWWWSTILIRQVKIHWVPMQAPPDVNHIIQIHVCPNLVLALPVNVVFFSLSLSRAYLNIRRTPPVRGASSMTVFLCSIGVPQWSDHSWSRNNTYHCLRFSPSSFVIHYDRRHISSPSTCNRTNDWSSRHINSS